MQELLYLREEYGDAFATSLPNGQIIPWRPLSMGEYLKYQEMQQQGIYPVAAIEDEIFKLCVLDKAFVKNTDKQLAGTVSAVVATIMAYSGPQGTDELNQFLAMSRTKASGLIHELVSFIISAFPAYKPEDIYAMEYKTLILRAAQAERKLINQGFITEPLWFEDSSQEEQVEANKEEKVTERRKQNEDLINQYYKQEGIQVSDTVKQARKDMREHIIDHPKPPPVPNAESKTTVITKSDMMEHDSVMTGHDQDLIRKMQSADATAQVYTNYLNQMKDGGELKIMTPEERKAAAEVRMEANKQKVLARRKETIEAAKAELPKLLKAREDARRRKEKKTARRNK